MKINLKWIRNNNIDINNNIDVAVKKEAVKQKEER